MVTQSEEFSDGKYIHARTIDEIMQALQTRREKGGDILAFSSAAPRLIDFMRARVFEKNSCWVSPVQVPCFSHSCFQNFVLSLLGHVSVPQYLFNSGTKSRTCAQELRPFRLSGWQSNLQVLADVIRL